MLEPDKVESTDSRIPVNYTYTPVLVDILQHLQTSFVVSTYQAGKVLVIGAQSGQLAISILDYDRPMGVAIGQDKIAIGAGSTIHLLNSNHAAAANVQPAGSHDGLRSPHVRLGTSLSDTATGWRADKARSGHLIDVLSCNPSTKNDATCGT